MISREGGDQVSDRELSGLFRDLVEGDPERGIAVLTGDRRVLYANLAARRHLKDGTPRGTDPLLPASLVPWVEAFSARAQMHRLLPLAETWYPGEQDRRLRLSLESYPREGASLLVLRCLPALPWPEPTVKRLQSRFDLSLREAQVAACVARGLSNLEAAHRLGIVEKTVKNALIAIFEKVQVRNRVELALRAFEAPVALTDPSRVPTP